MITVIGLKEIHDHLKSPAFLLSAFIVILLTAYSTMVGANYYQQRRDDYRIARSNLEKKQTVFFIFREPNPMSIFAQGYDTRAGSTVILRGNRIPTTTSGYMDVAGISQNFRYDAGILSIDYAFIVRMVMSIFVIFLVFDVIAGERKRGTLKIMLANPVPRDTILIGKILGGWIVITALLTVASMVSIVVVSAHPGIEVDADMALRFFGLYIASVVYLTVIFAVGLLISVIVNRSSTVLITLLVMWVVMTTVYPNLGCVAAQHLVQPPGIADLWKTPSLKTALERFNNSMGREIQASRESRKTSRSEELRHLDNAENIRDMEARLVYSVERKREDALNRQASLAVMLTMASPASLYDQAVMLIAGTSPSDYDRFFDYAHQTWEILSDANKVRVRDRESSQQMLEAIEPFHPGGIGTNFKETLYYLSILGLLPILFFALAYTGFLRKDIR